MNKIIVTHRTDDFHVCLENDPAIWGCGKSEKEAIGDLIQSHPEKFNVVAIESKK